MSISEMFKSFISNLAIKNSGNISLKYGEITKCLNRKFRNTESTTDYTLQIGSYGRWTGIQGISDLDMLYLIPSNMWNDYKDGKQRKLLTDIKDAIAAKYPRTYMRVDRCVVCIQYVGFKIEVQPVFKLVDGSFKYPDTANNGDWKIVKPRAEIKAMREFVEQKNNNLRNLCKMARAWKNEHGVEMGGLLIDTLAYNFLNSRTTYDDKSFNYYSEMCRDFFQYLSNESDKLYYLALGSKQQVKVKKKFQAKAKKAYNLCLAALEAGISGSSNKKWREVFGRAFPSALFGAMEASSIPYKNTEEFIETSYPIDIKYSLELECKVSQNGFRDHYLLRMLIDKMPLLANKKLKFYIKETNIQGKFTIAWKVLNRGELAKIKDNIRGQIITSNVEWDNKTISNCIQKEDTMFKGEHVVECYAIQNNIVVARGRIDVPITGSRS